MQVLRAVAFSLTLAACSLPVYDDSASATATSAVSTTSGSPPSTSSTSGAPTSSAATASTSEQSWIMEKDIHGTKGCDIWTEDCPEGQKCMPYSGDGDNAWESLKCVPIVPDPDQIGEPCTVVGSGVSGEDSCDKHTMCWGVDPDTGTGTCIAMCIGTPEAPDCADPNAGCLVSNDAVLILCIPDCDPLAQDCQYGGDVCVPVPDDCAHFVCVLQGAGEIPPLFGPCSYLNQCDRGQTCADPSNAVECDPMAEGCCIPFCDLDEPNTCPGVGQECVQWCADQADAAPYNVDVGLCSVP